MIDIDDYKLLFTNEKIKVRYFWIFISIFIICFILLLLINFNYDEYYQDNGIGTKEGYIKLIIPVDDVDKITNNSHISLDGELYKYRVINFNKEIINVGNIFYQELYINTNKIVQENRYITFKVKISTKSFYDFIKCKIGGSI